MLNVYRIKKYTKSLFIIYPCVSDCKKNIEYKLYFADMPARLL